MPPSLNLKTLRSLCSHVGGWVSHCPLQIILLKGQLTSLTLLSHAYSTYLAPPTLLKCHLKPLDFAKSFRHVDVSCPVQCDLTSPRSVLLDPCFTSLASVTLLPSWLLNWFFPGFFMGFFPSTSLFIFMFLLIILPCSFSRLTYYALIWAMALIPTVWIMILLVKAPELVKTLLDTNHGNVI